MRKIPYARVLCEGNEGAYVGEVLQSGWLTTAGKTAEFEKRFASAVGTRFALAVNSGTAALHLALEAMGIGPGDRVFVPTMTFTATAEVVRYLGADPVFLDIDYGTALVTPAILDRAIAANPGAKAFIPVHYGGQAAEMISPDGHGLLDMCRENGISVIEDAAHAFPAKCRGRVVGGFGDATCFSFYANKTITTAEGGMLTTDDERVAGRVKIMRLHGIDRDIWDRYSTDKPSWEYDVIAPGYKYNMPDLAAAVGLAQLERAESMRIERERCAKFYLRELKDVPGLDLPEIRTGRDEHAWHLFVVKINERAPVGRDRFIEVLAGRGIGTSVHYKPLHRMTYYRERYGLDPESWPEAEKYWKGCVSLPIYPSLTDEELAFVCGTIKEILS